VELDEVQTIQLCLAPLSIYALLGPRPLVAGPRGQWQLLRALEDGLSGDDPLSATLVDVLKSNLHKFHAHFCRHYARADAAQLLAALAELRETFIALAAQGIETSGFRRALERFADHLTPSASDPAWRERCTAVRDLLA
jgi:hypothetical protein